MEQPEADEYMGFNREEKDYLTVLAIVQSLFLVLALVIATIVICSRVYDIDNNMHSLMHDASNYYVYYSQLTQADMAELNDKISQAIPPTYIPRCKAVIYNTSSGTVACDGKVIAYVAKSHARP